MPRPLQPPPEFPELCVSDELIEAFAMGKLAGEDAKRVQAHVLECDICCKRLVDAADFIDALHNALWDVEKEE